MGRWILLGNQTLLGFKNLVMWRSRRANPLDLVAEEDLLKPIEKNRGYVVRHYARQLNYL